MKVKEVKLEKTKTVNEKDDVFKVAKKMGSSKSIIVLKNKRVLGIITMRDMVSRVLAKGKDPKKTFAKDIMTSPVFCAKENDDIEEIAKVMLEKDYLTVPVVNKKGEYKGVLTLRQIILHRKKNKMKK
ncbi:MAG: CBS domain-containing protein [Candidatus Aenigmatarchaeota archaeon]